MRVVEQNEATGTLAEYAAQIGGGPVIVTKQGQPIAALVAIENADMETVALSTNPQFIELIECSRTRVIAEGGISAKEMRQRFAE